MNLDPLHRLLARLGVSVAAVAVAGGCAGTLTDPGAFTSTAGDDAGVTSTADAAAGTDGASGPACPDIPALLATTCGTSGCHDAKTKAQSLDLASPGVATRLVGVPATEGVGLLIDPSTPTKSVLYAKLLPMPPFGARMPTGKALDDATTACVLAWVQGQTGTPNPLPTDAGAAVDGGGHPEGGQDAGTVAFSTKRVAAGQTASVMDGAGQVWSADEGFTGGTAAVETTPVAIANTNSPALYNGQRYGNPSFKYVFTVPDGAYAVTLRFAELYVTAAGQRVFSVVINGATVESAFDIYQAAGAMNSAVDRTYPVNVNSGQLEIDFNQGSVQFPKVDAIQIAQGTGSGDGGI